MRAVTHDSKGTALADLLMTRQEPSCPSPHSPGITGQQCPSLQQSWSKATSVAPWLQLLVASHQTPRQTPQLIAEFLASSLKRVSSEEQQFFSEDIPYT